MDSVANRLNKGRMWLLLAVLAAGLVLASILAKSPVANAANGDNLDVFDAAVTAGIPACGSGVGTGNAFDGTSLLLSCWGSNVIERVAAAAPHGNNGAVTISGLPNGADLNAMAWDGTRSKLWSCNGHSLAVLIDVGAAAWDGSQPPIPVAGCTDGLAYDGSDDSLWASPDVSSVVYHYKISDGSLIGSFPVAGLIGVCGNSGIAVGGPKLYLANNGCSEIYEVEKDGSASSFFASFDPFRLEDLECDNVTFAGIGKGAIWSMDAYDRIQNAWEIPADQCESGGGGGPTVHPGTVPAPFACGTYVRGGENSGRQLNPADYSYSIPSPLGISGAGVFADHHWVHSTGTLFIVYDMGAPVPAAFYIPSIDHGPIPGEAMEATLYGTNNLADPEGTWEAGTISDIYNQGVDAAWISDDYSTRWTFSQSYRYIGILHGGPGAIIDDGDAEIDAVCAEGTRVTATKFYDANANGVNDGEAGIANWLIYAGTNPALTDATGQAAFVLQDGGYAVTEGTPVQGNWFHTTPASVNIVVPDDESVSFGNVCVGAGGGRTLGYWSNKNGQAQMNDGGTVVPELALLSSLNLRNAAGADFNPTTYASFRTWILNANATNMAYMLSAQLAAMELNVEAGLVSGTAIIYAPGTASANALGFATVNDIMAEANAALGADGSTPAGDPNRAIQEALKNALDNANNNLTFVQATPCPFSFPLPGKLYAATDTEEFAGVPLPDRLAVIPTNGPLHGAVTVNNAEVYVNGLEATGTGDLYTGSPFSSSQDVMTTSGALVSSGPSPLPAGECCNEDIAFDGTHIWRAHWAGGALFKYLPDGTDVTPYAQTDVVGATFVGSTLWISKWSGKQVGTFDPGTNTFTSKFSTATNAGGLAYDAANKILWVGRQGGIVEAWSLAGPAPTLIAGSAFQPYGPIGDTIDGLAFIPD